MQATITFETSDEDVLFSDCLQEALGATIYGEGEEREKAMKWLSENIRHYKVVKTVEIPSMIGPEHD